LADLTDFIHFVQVSLLACLQVDP
jgi:hypothetical protein